MKRLALFLILATLAGSIVYWIAPEPREPSPVLVALQNGFDAVERCRPDLWAQVHGRGLPVASAISEMALELGVDMGAERRVTVILPRIGAAACGE